MCKLCWTISAALLLLASGLVYKFIISGATVPASDGRQALLLTPGERDLLQSEMRDLLESVHSVIQGANEGDMTKVVEAARRAGLEGPRDVPESLIGKLPLPFKKLGFDTHKQFDTLAEDAEKMKDPARIMRQLSALMVNCINCHSSYSIRATDPSAQ